MTEVHVHVASDLRGEVPKVAIVIDQPLADPDFTETEWEPKSTAFFESQAKLIADVLQQSLPGGTLDRLTAELLLRRAVLWRVPVGH